MLIRPVAFFSIRPLTNLSCHMTPPALRTVEHLFELTGLTLEDISARAGLSVERVMAIAEGRWTPSPEDRSRIAAAFGVPVSEISWGHTMNPRNIRYGRFGFKESLRGPGEVR